jgi:hypothetical protein
MEFWFGDLMRGLPPMPRKRGRRRKLVWLPAVGQVRMGGRRQTYPREAKKLCFVYRMDQTARPIPAYIPTNVCVVGTNPNFGCWSCVAPVENVGAQFLPGDSRNAFDLNDPIDGDAVPLANR